MTDIVLEIRLDPAAKPAIIPRNVMVDVTFVRMVPGPDKGREPALVQDVVRVALDERLGAQVQLGAAQPGTAASVDLLGADGTPLLTRHLTLPGRGGIGLTLSKADVEAYVGTRQKTPATAPAALLHRRVRFVPTSLTLPDFGSATVRYALIEAKDWKRLGLAELFRSEAPQSTALEWLGSGWNDIGSASWQNAHLSIDGRFDVQLPPGADFVMLWWLQGGQAAIGAIAPDIMRSARSEPELPAILPAFSAPSPVAGKPEGTCSTAVPRFATEAELADNPNVYSEDAGSFCKPFSNPERVLSERSFYTIVRAEQPAISARLSAATKAPAWLDFTGVVHKADNRAADATRAHLALDPAFAAKYVAGMMSLPGGRSDLDAQHPVQWEDDIARYQASGVARGHVLEHRVRWRSNGYSLGTVAKTLTLAPRQIKRIQKVDWERHEAARRAETTQQADHVQDAVIRDRQVDDTVRASLHEWSFGTSAAAAGGVAGGIGFFAEAVLGGIGAAAGGAGSVAYTESGRTTTATEEQRLRDSIRRYADSLRRLESVVVSEVSQEESVTGTSEVLRNFNYAHSLTVIYYQILRHLRVETAFAGVSECLFVPFAIKPFDLTRAYRWRESIGRALRQARYRRALDRVRDVATDFAQSDIPEGRRADQRVVDIRGSITIKLSIERPADGDNGSFRKENWNQLGPLLAEPAKAIHEALEGVVDGQRDRFFQANHAGAIAANWCNGLKLRTVPDGSLLDADFTLATTYRFGQTVRVDFTLPMTGELSGITRAQLQALNVRAPQIDLPPGSIANVTRMSLTYATENFEYTVQDRGGMRDLVRVTNGTAEPSGALATLPLTPWEKVDQRAEIVAAVNELVEHLNEHVEYYHKAIWWHMDRDRLYMLVDGFTVPGTNGVSIGSVVDREPMGIIGNSIVFRVSRGAFIGLGEIDTPAKLHNLYADNQPPRDPMHVSLPTDGLYAQTLLDPCPALEEHFGNFDWALSQPDVDPGTLSPELLGSRRSDPAPTLQPSQMPATLINLQNAPEAPAPSGLQGVLNAVIKGDSFRDLSGLAGNQANALAALQAASSLAAGFGNQAAQLAAKTQATNTADQKVASIKRAQDKGLIDQPEASAQTKEVLRDMHSPKTFNRPDQEQPIVAAIRNAAERPGSVIEASSTEGQVKVAMGGGNARSSGAGGSDLVNGVLAGAQKALNIGFDALGRWKSEPGESLGRLLQDGLMAEAKKAALDQSVTLVKRIPCGAALIEGVKLALAFADGVGAELAKTNLRLRADYDRKIDLVMQSDELTDKSIEALEELSAYQFNAVIELNGILRAGIDAALSHVFAAAVDGIGKVFKDNRDELIKHVVKEDEFLSVLNGGVSAAIGDGNDTRLKLLEFLVKGFVRQLPKSRLQEGLKTALGQMRGRENIASETFAGLCMAVLDAETGSIKAQLGPLAPDVRQLLLRELHAAFDAGRILPVASSAGQAVELDTAQIRIPATLKTELDTAVGALGSMTAEMRAAVDAFVTVKQTLELGLQHRTAQRLQAVKAGRLDRHQAVESTLDDDAASSERAAMALFNLEMVIRKLARAAGDSRLDDQTVRRRFIRDTLGGLFQFSIWRWDDREEAEPFEFRIDLANVSLPGGIDL